MADMAKGVAAGAKGEEPARGDRRTTPRTAVLETVAGIIAVDLDGGSNGIILDLGPAGMMVQSMAPLAARSTRTISFTLPDTTTPVRLQAVVVWSDDEGRAGLRFTSVPDDVRRRLETWLATNAARDILEPEPAASSMPPFSTSAQPDFSLDSASDDLPLSFADLAATLDASPAAIAPSSTPAASRLDAPAAGSPAAIHVSQEPPAAESPRVHFVNFSGLEAAAAAAPALDNAPVAPSQAPPSEVPADRIDQEAWHVIEEIFRLTPAQGAVVAIAEGDVITCRASRGHAPAVGARLQPEHGLSGECFRSGKVVICDDASVDPRVPAVVSQRLNLSSIVVVPILGPKSSLGLVEALSSDKHAFTSANVNTLTRLAALMSEVLCPAKPSQVPASVVPAPADVARPSVEPSSVAKPIEPAVAAPPASPAPTATKPEPLLPSPAAAPSTTVVNKPVVSTTATPGILTAATPVVPPPQEKTPTAPAAQETPASAANTTAADKAAPAPPAKPSAPVGTSVPKPAAPPIVPPAVPPAGQRKPEPLKPLQPLDEKAEQEKARASKAADEKPPETKIPDQKPRQEKPSAPPPQAPVAPPRVAMEPASAPRTEAPRTAAEKSKWRPVVPPAKPASAEPAAPSVYKTPSPVRPPAPAIAKPAPASAAAAAAVAPASAAPAPPLPLAETSITKSATETSTFSTSRTLALGGLATVVLLGIVAAWWTLTHRPELAPSAPVVTGTPAESAPAPQAPPQQNTTASANTAAASSPPPSSAASSASKPPDSKPTELKPAESKPSASKPAKAAAEPSEVFASEVDARAIRRPSAGRQTQAPLPQVQPPTVVVGAGSNLLALPIKPAQPSLVGPQRVSRGAVPGKVIHRVEPQYPASARAVKLTGTVVLAATIDRQGRPSSVRVVSGPPLLADAALQAYRQWRYEPAMLNNEPVESQTQVSFNFKLPQ